MGIASDSLRDRTDELIELSDFDWTEAERATLDTAAGIPNVWAAVISAFYAVKVGQQEAEANQEHAEAMRRLTWALVVVAALQVCVTVAGVLAAVGQVVATLIK